MKKILAIGLVGLIMAIIYSSWAPAEQRPNARSTTGTEPSLAADLAAIRTTETTFKAAFDAGNAQAVAAHWTVDGEYVDDSGRHLQGRDAIAKEYAGFFAANPGVHLVSHIVGLRRISADAAIEDGTAAVEPTPAGAPATSQYTVVHVKQDGKWLMSSVRDTRIETPTNYAHLEDFDRLIGTWVADNDGVDFQVTGRWIANKNFIEQSAQSTQDGQVISSGTQIVGWDPVNKKVMSWVFTSDGGHAVGTWTPHETGWMAEMKGVMIDGTPTTAVNILSRLDDNAVAWRSVNRSAGAFRVLDTNEVILRRNPAAHE